MENDLYKQMLDTALQVQKLDGMGEFSLITRHTAAKILSVVYVQSGDERIVLSPKVRADIEYIQKKYDIVGGGNPSPTIVKLIQDYVKEVEKSIKETHDFPQWAYDLFQERYNFKLYKP